MTNSPILPATTPNVLILDDDNEDQRHGEQMHKAQAAPKEGDQIFRAIVESALEGILVVQDGKRAYYNPRWLELTGYSAQEYATLPYSSLIHPADANQVAQFDDQVAAGQIPSATYEMRLITRSGEIRWLVVRASCLIWDNRPAVISVHEDITERKQAEQKLRYQATLLDNVSDAVITTDMNFIIQGWNDAARAMYGFAVDEVLGQRLRVLIPTEYPPDANAQLQEQGVWQGEVRQKHRDGSDLYVLSSVNMVRDDSGQPTSIVAVNRDITERVRAEEKLQQSEEKLRAIYTAIPVPTYTWQADGDDFVLTDSNEAGRRVSQGRIMELIGIRASVMYRDRPDIVDDMLRCYREKIAFQREMEYVLRTTGQRDFLDVKYAYVPPDQILVHTENINERKRIEAERIDLNQKLEEMVRQRTEELHEMSERLRLATSAAKIGVWDWDVQQDILVWDETVRSLFAVNEADFGGNHASFLAHLHPSDVEAVEQSIRASLQGATSYEKEFRIVTQGGVVRHLRAIATISYDANQQPVRMIGVNWDISEDKALQQALRLQGAALEAAANAIAIVDRQGLIRWVNPAFTRLTGYTQKDVIGRNPRLLKSGKHDAVFYSQMWRSILSGQTWRGQLVNRRKGGELYDEEMIISPLYDESGEISYFIAIKQDITERKRILTELQGFNDAMVDREGRIIELKEEINRLSGELGRGTPYPPIWESNCSEPTNALLLMEGDVHG